MVEEESVQCRHFPTNLMPPTPPGLEALYFTCRRIYPDQTNPLQVAALVKYWLGGPDPLDYISMYANQGNPSQGIPAHWHYISFGLSDLHGDGRVHEISGPDTPSGFGFELTFRLKRELDETAPPTWPATLLQALAKYVFQSGNTLCAGDHVSWHCALDNSESRIQHMLMSTDPQIPTTVTPFGLVNFIQVVGVCKEELLAAQRWNGPGVLDILKRLPGSGGSWLITDMRRGESMLELDPLAQEVIDRGIETDGSNLSGVSARCSWSEINSLISGDGGCLREGPAMRQHADTDQIEAALKKGSLNTKPVLPPIKPNSDCHKLEARGNSFNENCFGFASDRLEPTELLRTKRLDSLHLTFNLESGILLPLAIRGRVRHGRHFTFKSVLGDTAITLVTTSVTGTFVDVDKPYVAHGPWLQVLITEDFIDEMAETLEPLNNPDELTLPKTFFWGDRRLAITVLADSRF
uniref:Suppressor of fused homolog n=1 Tax=Clastoptera arizonana TaxID=38151 RepID=A0A1B6C1J0_9HEMI